MHYTSTSLQGVACNDAASARVHGAVLERYIAYSCLRFADLPPRAGETHRKSHSGDGLQPFAKYRRNIPWRNLLNNPLSPPHLVCTLTSKPRACHKGWPRIKDMNGSFEGTFTKKLVGSFVREGLWAIS